MSVDVDMRKGSGETRRCRLDTPVLQSVWERLVPIDAVDTSDPVEGAEAMLKQGLDLCPQKRLEEAVDCVPGEGAYCSRYAPRPCMVPLGTGEGDRCRLRVGGGGGEFGRDGAIVRGDQSGLSRRWWR